MRRANQNVGIFAENGNIALSFGFDFCAEHEWGVKGLNRIFGVSNDEDDATVQRFAVTKASADNLVLVEAKASYPSWRTGKKRTTSGCRLYLLGGDEKPYNQTVEEFVTGYRDSCPHPDKPEAHWDEGAFLFSVSADDKAAERLRKIHDAMLAGDALLYRTPSGPFGGAGLVITRRSTVPRETISKMEAELSDAKRLREAATATGIRERVEVWGRERAGRHGIGCAFFALSPRWKPKGHDPASAHPVVFWLNPYDQQNNNYGWFTVEELEQWMAGRGPIPKAPSPTLLKVETDGKGEGR